MLTKQISNRPRPYWHVDAKWIAGILLFVNLGACLLLYNLASLTERDHAVNISATIVASLFSPKGLDDASGLKEFRAQAAKMPGTTIAPIEQFPSIRISKHDALTLGPRDLKIALFSQITGPIYDLGLKEAAKQFTSSPADQQKFINQAQILGILTKNTHDILQRLFLISSVATVVLFGILVLFSAGWGRLVSPGVVLVSVSPVGTLASLILLHPPTGDGSLTSTLPSNIVEDVGASLSHSYMYAMILGFVLLAFALVGKIASSVLHRPNASTAA